MSDQSTSIKFTLSGAPKAWNEEAGELLGEWAEGIEAVFINSTESGEDFVTVDEIAWGGNEYSTRYYTKGGSLSVDGMEQKFAALFGDEFVKDGQLNLGRIRGEEGLRPRPRVRGLMCLRGPAGPRKDRSGARANQEVRTGLGAGRPVDTTFPIKNWRCREG